MIDIRTKPSSTRRRRGAMASLLMAVCATGGGVAAFSSSFNRGRMTMKMDVVGGGRRSKVDTKMTPPPGSPLSMLCQDQHEYELRIGHAMDTLRNDYPNILTEAPDYSIYDPNLELIDPSGVKLHGVKNYRASFRLLHAIVGIFYCPERSGLTFRMCFDKARQNIRIHWNAQVIPKAIFGGYKTTLHVDGISVYEIARNSGNITQHRIERLVINDASVMPEQGIFAALKGHAANQNVDGIPAFNVDGQTPTSFRAQQGSNEPHMVPFQNFAPFSRSVLFSSGGKIPPNTEDQQQMSSSQLSSAMSSSSLDGGNSNIDWDALEKKNQARKKFGMPPLTPEEFSDLQEQVAELDSQQQKRAAAAAAEMASKKKEEEGGLFKKLFGNVLEDTCESNYDCQRPEVCCDFGFKKMCCTSGMRILDGPPQSRQGQLAEIPVIANPGPNPPQGPQGDWRY